MIHNIERKLSLLHQLWLYVLFVKENIENHFLDWLEEVKDLHLILKSVFPFLLSLSNLFISLSMFLKYFSSIRGDPKFLHKYVITLCEQECQFFFPTWTIESPWPLLLSRYENHWLVSALLRFLLWHKLIARLQMKNLRYGCVFLILFWAFDGSWMNYSWGYKFLVDC